MKLPRPVEVRIAGGDVYPVWVAPGILDALPELLAASAPAHRYAIVADAQVASFHGARVRGLVEAAGRPVSFHPFPPGEGEKSRMRWAALTDELLAEGVGRDGCVVALGGGVAGDLAGFVAATYMRGIPVVHLPTSLVAMIDSAVGGKSGIDVPAGKNLVGAFHPPRFVAVDPELALTLTPGLRAQGLAEAVKHGAILDAPYLRELVAGAGPLLEGEVEATTRAVRRSVELKADIVSRDEREGDLRQVLNFGHTLGHALEALSGYRLPHGSAVARGMVLEAMLGERMSVTTPGTARSLAEALGAIGLDAANATDVERTFDPEEIVEATRLDKKARRGDVRYVLLAEAGRVAQEGEDWSRGVPDRTVQAVLARAREGALDAPPASPGV